MKARFFCESCAAEVSHAEKVCPSCGRTFTAVKCPRCGFEGGAKQFGRGCPQCGYLNVLPPPGGAPYAGSRARGRSGRTRGAPVRAYSPPKLMLPARFYRIALGLLIVLLVGLIVLLVLVTRR